MRCVRVCVQRIESAFHLFTFPLSPCLSPVAYVHRRLIRQAACGTRCKLNAAKMKKKGLLQKTESPATHKHTTMIAWQTAWPASLSCTGIPHPQLDSTPFNRKASDGRQRRSDAARERPNSMKEAMKPLSRWDACQDYGRAKEARGAGSSRRRMKES